MGRRRLLTDEQMAPFWAWASDERGIVQYYTLSQVISISSTRSGFIYAKVRKAT
jgi:hypothetical protein